MRRLLALWLTLVGSYWAARAGVALLFERAEIGLVANARLLLIPLLQTAVVAWATRERPEPDEP
jgi:hypothetical protein